MKTASYWVTAFHITDSQLTAYVMKHQREEKRWSGDGEDKEAEVATSDQNTFWGGGDING